jgi:hypothetical protein
LGLRNFFRRSNPEPTAPMAAAQLSPEMLRGEGIGDWRFVFMVAVVLRVACCRITPTLDLRL